MKAFLIEAINRPGELARVTELIAGKGINIEAFSIAYGADGALAILSHDEKGLQGALDDSAGVTYKEVPLLTIWLEDKPGSVAWAARKLADVGVNIEFFAPLDYTTDRKATVAIGVDKIDAARTALSDHLVEWTIPERMYAGSVSR
jgi:hypothetical protein